MYPPEVERLHSVLESLPGVSEVESGIQSLQGLTPDDLSLPAYARLPIGSLRRTMGGLNAEALIQIEFRIENSWKTVEFLAWFFRDQSRGGVSVQFRPFALPPQVADTVQLGHSLRWQVDLFCANTGTDLSPQFQALGEIARDLEFALEIYGSLLFGNRDA